MRAPHTNGNDDDLRKAERAGAACGDGDRATVERLSSVQSGGRSLAGIAQLNYFLYTVYKKSNVLKFFTDNKKLVSNWRFTVPGMTSPGDMAACRQNACLYVVDSLDCCGAECIWRVRHVSAYKIKVCKWFEYVGVYYYTSRKQRQRESLQTSSKSPSSQPRYVSVTGDGRVLLSADNRLTIISGEGSRLSVIDVTGGGEVVTGRMGHVVESAVGGGWMVCNGNTVCEVEKDEDANECTDEEREKDECVASEEEDMKNSSIGEAVENENGAAHEVIEEDRNGAMEDDEEMNEVDEVCEQDRSDAGEVEQSGERSAVDDNVNENISGKCEIEDYEYDSWCGEGDGVAKKESKVERNVRLVDAFGGHEAGRGDNRLNKPGHLAVDLQNARLFVADTNNTRVLMFEGGDLSRRPQVLLRTGCQPTKMCFDGETGRLCVGMSDGKIDIYRVTF